MVVENRLTWDRRIQKAAEDRLADCYKYLEAWEDEVDGVEDWPPLMLAGPFCGCETCVVREVIDAAFPIIKDYVLQYGDEA